MNIQIWEVTLRNKINAFLCWKFGAAWPFDDKRFVRNLQENDKRRLNATLARQRQMRGGKRTPTDAIVADLSAGFWVSLLTKSYDVPFVWRHNLPRIFPHKPEAKRGEMSTVCDRLLMLRNRIAHHEPIHHLPLEGIRAELSGQIAAMCAANEAFAIHACTFATYWATRPSLTASS